VAYLVLWPRPKALLAKKKCCFDQSFLPFVSIRNVHGKPKINGPNGGDVLKV
jgi:hypothetical protein